MQNKEEQARGWQSKIPTLIAVTTLLLAVCATLTAFKAGGYGNKMVLAQNQASDQWAFYQAKSIKETTYRVQLDAMTAAYPPGQRPPAIEAQAAAFAQEAQRYKAEKEAIEQEAHRWESVRDTAQGYNTVLGQALMFLQVGILLSSLATINKVYGYWYAGSAIGVVGIGLFLYAMLLL